MIRKDLFKDVLNIFINGYMANAVMRPEPTAVTSWTTLSN